MKSDSCDQKPLTSATPKARAATTCPSDGRRRVQCPGVERRLFNAVAVAPPPPREGCLRVLHVPTLTPNAVELTPFCSGSTDQHRGLGECVPILRVPNPMLSAVQLTLCRPGFPDPHHGQERCVRVPHVPPTTRDAVESTRRCPWLSHPHRAQEGGARVPHVHRTTPN